MNLQMVRAGMAWHYKEYESEQNSSQRRQYSKAESRARSDRLGLWDGERIAYCALGVSEDWEIVRNSVTSYRGNQGMGVWWRVGFTEQKTKQG